MRLVQLCFDFYMIEAKPENLIGDRAYDSDPLDAELRKDGIEMIAPHRRNRSKPPTQDRRRLSRYMRRWLVERFFAWIQWQRRSPHSLGVPRLQFPRLCPTCLPRYPLQTILR
jgi:IS5 family transposase